AGGDVLDPARESGEHLLEPHHHRLHEPGEAPAQIAQSLHALLARARSRVDPAPEEGCRDAGVRVTELRLEERLPETSVAAEAGARREELLARHRIELIPVARLLEDAEAEPHL